ncbi:50S ribosomal protein L23 [Candidatus Saccharibacteria bacterium]|nr:50S ribosomal protein L23 [Candidatus Saccharibacteria bacterium]
MKLHIIEPRATEKTYLEQAKRTYVFPVKLSTSKQEVAAMVEKEFGVKVVDVRTLIRDGKKTKFSKGKHAYPGITHRQDKKFAYVTLAEGDSIKVFDEPETEKKEDKVSAKEAKKAEKEAKKADKEAAKADKNAGKENK